MNEDTENNKIPAYPQFQWQQMTAYCTVDKIEGTCKKKQYLVGKQTRDGKVDHSSYSHQLGGLSYPIFFHYFIHLEQIIHIQVM